MTRRFFSLILLLIAFTGFSMDAEIEFGKVCIDPYITAESGIAGSNSKLLMTKMSQLLTQRGVTSGYSRRFIITPAINVLSEETTATIPQKTSVRVAFTFFVGDCMSGALYSNCCIEAVGVGDSHDDAIFSAIRKISVNAPEFTEMLSAAESKIIEYYNKNASEIILQAQSYIESFDYETAISILTPVPSFCNRYEEIQELICLCGRNIIERNNANLINQAKSYWNTHPDEYGADMVYNYLSKIVNPSKSIKAEADKLNSSICSRLRQIEKDNMHIYELQLISEEKIRTEEIKASAQVAASFFSALPKLIVGVLKWF